MGSKTYSVVVEGDAAALAVVSALAKASVWFTFEPLPDGEYDLTVKVEHKGLLQREVADAMRGDLGVPCVPPASRVS